jgi:tRNA threonylcarbamoyladenosine biosynthesis protein TsaE
MIKGKKFLFSNEQETIKYAKSLTKIIPQDIIVYLKGDLGSGKTTFVRGFLQGAGFNKSVRSPTYTIVEPYEELEIPIYHFDLYRLANPEELEYIGIRDFIARQGICFFEWPEKGLGILPPADLTINFFVQDDKREVYIEYNSKKIPEL